MDTLEKILDAEWCSASSLSTALGLPSTNGGDGEFLSPGASIELGSVPEYERIKIDLSSSVNPDNAFMFQDAQVLGNGFVVYTAAGRVRETRYLVNNLQRRVELSLRDEPIKLRDSIAWIAAGNASSRHNYWHWFAQVLPALLHSREFGYSIGEMNIGVVCGPLKPWQRESLDVLGIPNDRVVEIDQFQSAEAKKLIYSSYLSGTSVFSSNEYRSRIRQVFLRWAGDGDGAGGKIVISRRDTRKRALLNEEELHRGLEAEGYRIVSGGDLTLREQVQIFGKASIIVAPHGAGSTNVLFARPGAAYVELGQSSYPNAGPLSLCKTSGVLAWLDLFADDGRGQSTNGWYAPLDLVQATISSAENR